MQKELRPTSGYHVEIVYDNLRDLRMVLAVALFGPAGFASRVSQRNIERMLLGESDDESVLRETVRGYIDALNTGDPYRSFWIASTANHYLSAIQYSSPKGSVMVTPDSIQQRADEILDHYVASPRGEAAHDDGRA